MRVQTNVKFPVHRMCKREPTSSVNTARWTIEVSVFDFRQEQKSMFFYAEIGERMYLRIFGKFFVACAASRRRKRLSLGFHLYPSIVLANRSSCSLGTDVSLLECNSARV